MPEEEQYHHYKMCIELAYNKLVTNTQTELFALGAILYTIQLS